MSLARSSVDSSLVLERSRSRPVRRDGRDPLGRTPGRLQRLDQAVLREAQHVYDADQQPQFRRDDRRGTPVLRGRRAGARRVLGVGARDQRIRGSRWRSTTMAASRSAGGHEGRGDSSPQELRQFVTGDSIWFVVNAMPAAGPTWPAYTALVTPIDADRGARTPSRSRSAKDAAYLGTGGSGTGRATIGRRGCVVRRSVRGERRGAHR